MIDEYKQKLFRYIYKCESGDYVYCDTDGFFYANDLRIIADEIDRLNGAQS